MRNIRNNNDTEWRKKLIESDRTQDHLLNIVKQMMNVGGVAPTI